MHHAKPNAQDPRLEDSNAEPCDKPSRVKATDVGFHIPDHILPDIVLLADPRLHYSCHHAQRDRRLRLLIRRYMNQIQYGCRNINCATVTCLSYRKRNTTGPVRRYTDVSARTLACQLVDDYTRAGKDSFSSLCPNEPTIPWYEDPAFTKKRRDSIERHSHHRNKAQENGHFVKNTATASSIREFTRHAPLAEHPVKKTGTSHEGMLHAGRRVRGLESIDPLSTGESAQTIDSSFKPNNGTSYAGSMITPSLPARKKDTASFTQTLFDLMPLGLLSWFPSTARSSSPERPTTSTSLSEKQKMEMNPELPTNENDHESTSVLQRQLPPENQQPEELEQNMTTRVTRYSLRTFTWDSAVWLRAAERVVDLDTFENSFFPFLKQSLSYCLNDPKRLIATARDFQGTYSHTGEAHRDDYAIEPGGSTRDAQLSNSSTSNNEPSSWPTVQTQTRLDLEGLFMSLSFLDNFQQRDLVLSSIFEALQHSYALPPWLENRRTGFRSRSTGLNGDHPFKSQNCHKNRSTDPFSVGEDNEFNISDTTDKAPTHLKDTQVSELCLVALLFLTALIFDGGNLQYWGHALTFARFRTLRNGGLVHYHWPPHGESEEPEENKRAMRWVGLMIEAIDVCEDWSVLRLLAGIMDVISHRLAVAKSATTARKSQSTKQKTIVELLIGRFDRNALQVRDEGEVNPSWVGTAVVELVRTVMLRNWDRNPIVQRAGPVGGALELLAGIYRERHDLHLDAKVFMMPFIADTFDDISMPSEWLLFRADTRQMHLLSFSFLFEPATLVKYFRSMNIEIMRKSHEDAALVYNDTRHFMWTPAIPIYGAKEVLTHLRPHMAKYFVLTIRRDDVLNDAINQIWRREPQELMRPLRVRLGKDEGEDGLDHGGVQQEFFRVAFAEAFQPDYGMFTVDGTTRMTWFQPGSFEPLYRFEALGVLMSIAVYNGITVPITFPLAFYRKLLDLKVKKLEHISDGWPELARGLQILLDWKDGDVGDIIARTYEFSYELCGTAVTVDMQMVGRDEPWPPSKPGRVGKGKERAKSTSFELPPEPSELTPPSQYSPDLQATTAPGLFPSLSRTSSISIKGITTPISMSDSDLPLELPSTLSEAALVTNANRAQYVKDYILWLTHKSVSKQYEAFARGFYTCLDRTALSIFTPEALKSVIEGHPEIDVDELERTATYDDYTHQSQTIIDFWHVVRSMSPEQHRQLLEFATASDRVPVNGMSSVTFIIQRNGDDDTRLPSSSTCYGRLLLPQYSDREILEAKLTKAIENCVGFGTL